MKNKTGRRQISEIIAFKHNISQDDALLFLNTTIDELTSALKNKKDASVKIPNFGVFYMRHKNSRLGRNPKNMEPHIIAERRVCILRYCRPLKERLNNKKGKKP